MAEIPSYEELRDSDNRGRGPGNWVLLVTQMEPGEVQAVDPGETAIKSAQVSVVAAARRHGIRVFTRIMGGVLYVVRLRDEDIPDA